MGLLRQYQANLTRPDEQTLKNSVGKVSAILGSQLFQALLGKEQNPIHLFVFAIEGVAGICLPLRLHITHILKG